MWKLGADDRDQDAGTDRSGAACHWTPERHDANVLCSLGYGRAYRRDLVGLSQTA